MLISVVFGLVHMLSGFGRVVLNGLDTQSVCFELLIPNKLVITRLSASVLAAGITSASPTNPSLLVVQDFDQNFPSLFD
jgi:hypothetical protein